MLRWLGCILAAVLLCSCFGEAGNPAAPPGARTLFVDVANNTGKANGNRNSPFLKVSDALGEARGGDTIRIEPGTYLDAPLLVDRKLRIVGAGASQTTLQCDGTGPVFSIPPNTKKVVLEGMTLTGGFDVGGGLFNANRSTITVRDCLITGNAVGPRGGTPEQFASGAVRVANGTYVFERCIFWNNTATGIGAPSPGHLEIRNCIIAGHTDHGILLRGDPDTTAPDLVLVNTTISGVPNQCLRVDGFGDARVTNSIFASATRGIAESPTGGDPLLRYNCFALIGYGDADTNTGSRDPVFINSLDPPGTNVGNLVDDPLFVDPNAGDFRLMNASVCRDAGDPGILDDDGTRSDMGAFGGPGGSALADVAMAIPGMSTATLSSDRDLAPVALREPRGVPGRPLATDWDGDGREDRFEIEPTRGRLALWLGVPGGGFRPGPVPPHLDRVEGVSTFDVNGNGEPDLLVLREGEVEAYTLPGQGSGWITVKTSPGDLVEVQFEGQEGGPLRRVVPSRGDQWDGGILVGIGRAPSAKLRILRDGEEIDSSEGILPGATFVASDHETRKASAGSPPPPR